MYAGHVAIALGVRGVRRDLPLWVLVLASQACDWVELIVHPFTRRVVTDVYSHAYPFVLVHALIAAALVWLWKRSASAALTVLFLYLSHPVADYITGYKPLWLGGPNLGLQVVARPGLDFVVQGLVCLLGFAIYWRSVPATRRRHLSAALPLLLLLTLQGLSDWRLEWNKLRRQRLTGTAVTTLYARATGRGGVVTPRAGDYAERGASPARRQARRPEAVAGPSDTRRTPHDNSRSVSTNCRPCPAVRTHGFAFAGVHHPR